MVELLEPWEHWMPKNKVDPLSPTWLTIKKVELEALVSLFPDDTDKPKWLKQLKEVNRRLDLITKYFAEKHLKQPEEKEKKEPELPPEPTWRDLWRKLSDEYRQTTDDEEKKQELLEKMIELARKNIYEKSEVCQHCHKPLSRPFPDPTICNDCLKKGGKTNEVPRM